MFKKIRNLLNKQNTLEKKLFWGLTILVFGVTLITFVITLLEVLSNTVEAWALWIAGICLVPPVVIMLICRKTGEYGKCYMAMTMVIAAILMPAAFFVIGGFDSGMMIYCLGGLCICGFCKVKKYRILAFTVSMISCVVCFVLCAFEVVPVFRSFNSTFKQADMIISFIIIGIAMFLLYAMVLDEYEKAIIREGQEAERKAEMRLEMMSIQLENVADLKRIRHDVRHHNALILEYAQNGDLDGLKRYMKQKMDTDEYYATKIYCMNAVVNNILTVYTRRAQKENINANVTADVMNNLNISEPDLVAVIANLFENAIHGTREQTEGDKIIEVDVHTKGERLVVKCSNSCKAGMELIDGYPTERPGTGINSITNAANNYDGTVSYKLVNNILTCTVIMAIPAKNA